MKRCPIHGKKGLLVFMCCRGAAGGKKRSPAKDRAIRKNLTRATRARETKATS